MVLRGLQDLAEILPEKRLCTHMQCLRATACRLGDRIVEIAGPGYRKVDQLDAIQEAVWARSGGKAIKRIGQNNELSDAPHCR